MNNERVLEGIHLEAKQELDKEIKSFEFFNQSFISGIIIGFALSLFFMGIYPLIPLKLDSIALLIYSILLLLIGMIILKPYVQHKNRIWKFYNRFFPGISWHFW
jgi:hypothetical protein